MKKNLTLLAVLFFMGIMTAAAQSLQPYFNLGTFNENANSLEQKVSSLLTENGYEVLGTYHPGDNNDWTVLAFTSDAIKKLSLEFKDRGALAAVLKVGMIEKDGKTTLSIQNPEYMFLAYWGKQMNGQEQKVTQCSKEIMQLFSTLGTPEAFGGSVKRETLPKYHYKIMMPYFDDPDELAEFSSFEEGVKIISENLKAGKGKTKDVYTLIFPDQKIAVFGVGLMDKETGSAHFLPIIGESHLAAMPYQIILQGTKTTALPGRYRLALFWPDLTMGTFMKIMSTPGNIKTTLKELTQK
ncbi:MAG: hypothetical protein JXR65_00215 [Bacteroidales bacterium]|nr:hypothetical protein [Bacteroidales bacterium]